MPLSEVLEMTPLIRNGEDYSNCSSKKDQVLKVARSDPFLSIQEIADNVGTTPRYVRTILSESNVSLTDLRLRHARSMERELGIGRASFGSQQVRDVRVECCCDSFVKDVFKDENDMGYLAISRVRCIENRPFCIDEVITGLRNVSSHNFLRIDQPFYLTVCPDLKEEIKAEKGPSILARARKETAERLEIEEGSLIIIMTQRLVSANLPDRVMGIERNIYRIADIRATLPDLREIELGELVASL